MCRHFWENLQDWLINKMMIDDMPSLINRKNVILGLCSESNDVSVINCILLHAKWFIFNKKYNKAHSINFIEFVNMLRVKVDINLTISRHQNNQAMSQKMSTLLSLLD